MAGTDFSHLTNDELIKGIKALDLPDYIRSKAYGIDVRETLAQMTEMLMQLAYNQGMSPQQAKEWVSQLNNKIDKGNVSVSDINKNLGKLDQSFMTDEFIEQFVENTQPINTIPSDNSLTTAKYVDGSVTNRKLSPRFFEKGSFNSGDLNNFGETGTYYVEGTGILNKPDNIYTGVLTVFNAYTGWTTQIFHDIQPTNNFYIRNLRFWNGVASHVGEWQQMGIDSYLTTNNEEWVI